MTFGSESDSKVLRTWSPRTLGVETPTGRTAPLQVLRDFIKFHDFLLKIPNPENFRKFWTKFEIVGFQSKNQLSVNGMSYFEIEPQLLTFRKDILPYELAYHLIPQNGNGCKKVEGENSGVHCRTDL